MTERLPSCSVIICTRNRPELLDRCLTSLARLDYGQYEVVVVDNAPSDRRSQAVAERWGARYLVEPQVGLSHARNAGARACSSDIVMFTDDDAIPDSLWVSKLVRPFSDPNVVAVTGRVVPLTGEDGGAALPDQAGDFGPAGICVRKDHPHWFEMAHFGGIGNGNNMAFRREVFARWSGFDTRLGRGAPVASGEEHRAFGELIERGGAVAYTPDAVVRHPVPFTTHERREQHLRAREDLAAYAVFLFVETGHRWRVARYVAEAAVGVRRGWRFRTAVVPAGLVARRDVVRAFMKGAWVSVQASMRRRLNRVSGFDSVALKIQGHAMSGSAQRSGMPHGDWHHGQPVAFEQTNQRKL